MLWDFARRGKLQPLSASTSALVERNYRPLWQRLASWKGRMYGVWLKAANKSTVWYSRRNFTAASVRPPATWQQLQDVAARLHAVGIPPIAIAGADGWTLTDLFENVYLHSAGPTSYDRLAKGDLPWTDETVHEALRLLSQILRRPRWIAGGTRAALQTGFAESVAQVFAEPRGAGMLFEGDFVRTRIDDLSQHVQRSDVAAFALHRDGAVVAGGDVAVQLTANGGARRLMRFLGTPQAAEPWARAGGFISPNRKLKLSTYPDPITREQARALTLARIVRFDLSDLQPPAFGATAGHGMWAFFRRYLSGDITTDALTRRLQNGARYARSCQRANVGVC
jgi:alpha-glucoside transport system substrate-binding protein